MKQPHRQAASRSVLRTLFATATLCVMQVGVGHAAGMLTTKQIAENVYVLIGPLTDRSPENLGNNANFGVIVTADGVLLIDSGATYQGAEEIHQAIQRITQQPVKIVINSGGQDHRWLGNGYFKALGARIIANDEAVADQKARVRDQLSYLTGVLGAAGVAGTEPVYADQTFTDRTTLSLGGTRIEMIHAGHAHTPGDILVWLPDQQIMFAGDIVYVDRLLGVGSQSAHRSWISAFETMAALQPKVVVGGHGEPSDLAKATADTYDYLVFLRSAVHEFMKQGKGIEEVGTIEQSRFSYLENYDTLKGRNAQRVFEELEWE